MDTSVLKYMAFIKTVEGGRTAQLLTVGYQPHDKRP